MVFESLFILIISAIFTKKKKGIARKRKKIYKINRDTSSIILETANPPKVNNLCKTGGVDIEKHTEITYSRREWMPNETSNFDCKSLPRNNNHFVHPRIRYLNT